MRDLILSSGRSRLSDQGAVATALLGDRHPLAGALRRRRVALEQLRATALVLAAAATAALAGVPDGVPLLLAGIACALVVGCRSAALALDARQRAIDLVIAGHEDIALRSVQREAGRLRDPRTRARLSRSLAAAVQRANAAPRATRPHTVIVRPPAAVTAREAIEIGAQLLADIVPVRAVAAVERLICDAGSPLYGQDHERLRQELRRIRYLLQDGA